MSSTCARKPPGRSTAKNSTDLEQKRGKQRRSSVNISPSRHRSMQLLADFAQQSNHKKASNMLDMPEDNKS